MSTSAGWIVLVHGGAAAIDESRADRVRAGCEQAAAQARDILERGGSALDAVEAAVQKLEDDEEFNAGYGASLTREGTVEVDAAIMSAEGLRAGAVAAVPDIRHPVTLARRVLEAGEHVLLVSTGAIAFAREHGIMPEPPGALVTEGARNRLARWRAGRPEVGGDTVGAVARDRAGRLAAATSTGGWTGKRSGRVGDCPILGAGTYADPASGACSATGHGEAILRVVLAKSALDRLGAAVSAMRAAWDSIDDLAARTGGEAGLLLLAAGGDFAVAHNAPHMPHAIAWQGAAIESAIVARRPNR